MASYLLAMAFKDTYTLRMLLEMGVDPQTGAKGGRTPMELAEEAGRNSVPDSEKPEKSGTFGIFSWGFREGPQKRDEKRKTPPTECSRFN